MKYLVAAISILLLALTSPADAKHRHHHRHHARVQAQAAQECVYDNSGRTVCQLSAKTAISLPNAELSPAPRKNRIRTEGLTYDSERIVSHPSGCPSRAFCGCGVSVRVFGHPVRNLYLASNWYRFPRAHPAPGMVAVRNHHVMFIEHMDANGNAVVYDPNSGNHMTRVHTRSLSGYKIVNPHGQNYSTRTTSRI